MGKLTISMAIASIAILTYPEDIQEISSRHSTARCFVSAMVKPWLFVGG
jgi:hypothetical protein